MIQKLLDAKQNEEANKIFIQGLCDKSDAKEAANLLDETVI